MRRGHWNADRVQGTARILEPIKAKLYLAELPNGKRVTAYVDEADEIAVELGTTMRVSLSLADFDHARIEPVG